MKCVVLKAMLALAFLWHATVGAQGISQQESDRIWAEAQAAAQAGPTRITLQAKDKVQGTLALPTGHLFIPQPHATQVLNAMGNAGKDEQLQGLVFPDGNAPWFMTVRFEAAGYVKDDEAKNWNVDSLLQSYKKGTAAANTERKKVGMPEMEILGWAQQPAYDPSTHQLVWALSSRDKGTADSEPPGVNYNTYVLGREGYFTMSLVTDLNALPTYQPVAQALLGSLQFAEGKRYPDFNPSTDRVADHGLAALVVGVAAHTPDMVAALALWSAKFWKACAIALLALVGGLYLWRKKRAAREVQEDFALTVMVDRHAPERTLPQPLAPHPHADQVSTKDSGPKA